MSEQFENASEIIFFTPRSQYRWMYEIDGGKKHIITQDDLSKFIGKYVSRQEIKLLGDIVMRHQPFMVLIKEHRIVELHKTEDTLAEQSSRLRKEIEHVTKYGDPKKTEPRDDGRERFQLMTERFSKM